MVCVKVKITGLLDPADLCSGLAGEPVHHHGGQALGQGEGDLGDEVGGGHALVLASVEGEGSAQPPHLVHHAGVEPPRGTLPPGG